MDLGDVLRDQASSWSLSGDRQLLEILQQMQKKVMTNAHQANTKLDEMMSSIQDASIALHNVNNRFMALSNTQFIESRVYDDDDVADDTPVQVEQKPTVNSKPTATELLQSIRTLEEFYEEVTILPETSDESSGSEDEVTHSIVLKARDIYSERPLPHLIGSKLWYSKWHAGLLEEDSDTESAISKRESEFDTYSDDEQTLEERQQSFTSESIAVSEESYQKSEPINANILPAKPQSQSHLAAELARRFGGEATQPVAHTPIQEEQTHRQTDKKPVRHMFSGKDQSVSAAIFSDEPPPLTQSDDEDDIFSDINKISHSPKYDNQYTGVFDNDDQGDIFDDFAESHIKSTSNVQQDISNTIIRDEVTSEDIGGKNINKKPAGAVSLFGNKSGAESIGAAILKRNQKPSTSSDDEPAVKPHKSQKIVTHISEPIDNNKQSKEIPAKDNILDEVFVKSDETRKLLLKDDIFDDIDDIFATDAPKTANKISTKNIFDDDDDLFSDINLKTSSSSNTKKEIKSNMGAFKDIFADDNEDDLFSDVKIYAKKDKEENIKFNDENPYNRSVVDNNTINKNDSTINPDKINTDNKKLSIPEKVKDPVKNKQSPSLFDEDDEIDNLFNTSNITKYDEESSNNNRRVNIDQHQSTADVQYKEVTVANDQQSLDKRPVISNMEVSAANEKLGTEIKEKMNLQQEELYVKDDKQEKQEVDKATSYMETSKDDNFENKIDDIFIKNINHKSGAEIEDLETNNDNPNDSQAIEHSKSINVISTEQEFTSNLQSENLNILNEKDDLLFKTPENDTKNSFINDEFATIFNDQPPVFEKTKETKKSKNVNALFDDDSDDEALFFKKSDHFEDKIDDNMLGIKNEKSPNFGLFYDEPPEINDDIFAKDNKENTNSENQHNINDAKNETQTEGIFVEKSSNTNESNLFDVNITKPNEIIENIFQQTNITKDDTDSVQKKVFDKKPIGRVKSNLNINVNTLLPGASPKKTVKINDETPNINTIKTQESTQKDNNTRIIKSASFEDVPDSSVLCNKLSKERPRIQVKRRPSSRKARKNAITKSNTDSDLNKSLDLTDNSTESDITDNKFGISTLGNLYTYGDDNNLTDDENTTLHNDKITRKHDVKVSEEEVLEPFVKKLTIVDDEDDEDIFKAFAPKPKEIQSKNYTKESPTYSDDDDIFSSIAKKDVQDNKITNIATEKQEKLTKTTESFQNEEDYLFKTAKVTEETFSKKVTHEDTTKTPEKNQYKGDNLFKTPELKETNIEERQDIIEETPLKKEKVNKEKITLFDSSSDEELFGAKPNRNTIKIKQDNIVLEKSNINVAKMDSTSKSTSLFGEESDDDLFCKTTKNKGLEKPTTRQTSEKSSTATKPAFEDPLSMLGADEEFL